MKIKELTLKNFTVFEDARFAFSPGLNVVIGENGTGKSHILKLMYAIAKGADSAAMRGTEAWGDRSKGAIGIAYKLRGVFKPDHDDWGRLVRRHAPGAEVALRTNAGEIAYSFPSAHKAGNGEMRADFAPRLSNAHCAACVFIPPQDVLALYENFIGAYSQRVLSLDETYNDICVAMNIGLLREEPQWAAPVLRRLEKPIGGKVKLKGDRFYVGSLEAHLVAAGHRKLAEIARLIANGSIAPDTVVFWDEPEAGLNPRLITTTAEVIAQLAAAGVQIFIATHDFLLCNGLSVIAEYSTAEGLAARPRFFGLSKRKTNAAVEVEAGDTIAEIRNNPIVDEYAAEYEREADLFARHGAEKS